MLIPIIMVLIFLAAFAYQRRKIGKRKKAVSGNRERIFSPSTLKMFNGITNPEVYLALKNIVYDVTNS